MIREFDITADEMRDPRVRHEWGSAYEPVGGHGLSSLLKRCKLCGEKTAVDHEGEDPGGHCP
jgi:hypothetical protein